MSATSPKVPKPSDPQLVRRSQNSAREAWRMFEIIAEFVTATERLQTIQPAVAIFGSARVTPDHAYYQATEDIAKRLSEAGFSVISGGGPGIMEAANSGAYRGSEPERGPQHPAPARAVRERVPGRGPHVPALLRAQGDVREALVRVRDDAGRASARWTS